MALVTASSGPAVQPYWQSAFGIRRAALGRLADALPAGQEAVTIRRELAAPARTATTPTSPDR
jgi:hypothetical protein